MRARAVSRAVAAGAALAFLCAACSRPADAEPSSADVAARLSAERAAREATRISDALRGLPETIAEKRAENPGRFGELLGAALSGDRSLLVLVDKAHALPETYEPADLAGLDSAGVKVSRKGMQLRAGTLDAAVAMAKAARAEGAELVFSSCYRAWGYQKTVYERYVREMGKAAADRVSAMPGHSQHQLGTAVDFGSIDNSFASTKAGRWMAANARRWGFSLSYPEGMEGVTGYSHESWHYRYVGPAAAALEGEFFGGVQQYLMTFLDRYLAGEGE